MRQPPPRRPPAPRALPWLVLAAHLLALLLLGQALRPHTRGDATSAARPLWLRLLPAPGLPAPPAPPPEPPPAHRPSHPPAPAQPRSLRADSAAPRPDTPTAAPQAEAITPPAVEPPTAARAPEPPSPSPLDLRLAPAQARAPAPAAAMAREDPRANSARPGSEERMARTLGTDLTLRESVDPDGTRTFRRGRDCVVARPAREGQLNPFNQSTRPTPRLVEKC